MLGIWLGDPGTTPDPALARLYRYWGQGNVDTIPAQDELDLTGLLFGFAGRLPAAALLAEAEGMATQNQWVLALEPVRIGGAVGRTALEPSAMQESERAILVQMQDHFSPLGQLQISQGRAFLFRDRPLDLQSRSIGDLWGQAPSSAALHGQDGKALWAILNTVHMELQALAEAQGQESSVLLWPWGEGQLPGGRIQGPWSGILGGGELWQATAQYLGIPYREEPPQELALWRRENWFWAASSKSWGGQEWAASLDVGERCLRLGQELQIYVGPTARGSIQRLRLKRWDRWCFWRRPKVPGQKA